MCSCPSRSASYMLYVNYRGFSFFQAVFGIPGFQLLLGVHGSRAGLHCSYATPFWLYGLYRAALGVASLPD